jgi:Domain of unknown function (DUF4386)
MHWSPARRWPPCMTGSTSSHKASCRKSRLVPRVLPVLAFIGAPLLLISDAAVLFGVVERVSALPAIATLPVALFEFSLGVYLTVKGFRPSPITAGMV